MNRLRLNWIVDAAAASAFVALVVTGLGLFWVLPPGTNRSLELGGLSRHAWGEVHLWVALAFLAVLVLHLVLHWNWVCAATWGRFGMRAPGPMAMRIAGLCASVLIVAGTSGVLLGARAATERVPTESCRADASGQPPEPRGPVNADARSATFVQEVRSIFKARCAECHSGEEPDGDFTFDRAEDYFRLYADAPLIVARRPDESMLLRIVRGEAPGLAKPKKHRLEDAEFEVVRRWIAGGAVWTPRTDGRPERPPVK